MQSYALEWCLFDDDRQKSRAFTDEMKMALLSHTPASMDKLWPDLFPPAEATEEDLFSGEPMEVKFAPMDPNEAEAILSRVLADATHGRLGADDLMLASSPNGHSNGGSNGRTGPQPPEEWF